MPIINQIITPMTGIERQTKDDSANKISSITLPYVIILTSAQRQALPAGGGFGGKKKKVESRFRG